MASLGCPVWKKLLALTRLSSLVCWYAAHGLLKKTGVLAALVAGVRHCVVVPQVPRWSCHTGVSRGHSHRSTHTMAQLGFGSLHVELQLAPHWL